MLKNLTERRVLLVGSVMGLLLAIGAAMNAANPASWMCTDNPPQCSFNGNVHIGPMTPTETHRFHVVAQDAVGLFESTGSQAFLRLSTKEGLNNRVEIANRPGGKLSLWTAGVGAGDIFNITRDGNVGIGTTNPNHRFHVVAQDAVGLFESTGSQAFLRFSTKEGFDNRVEIANRPGGKLSLWTSGAGDVFNITRDGHVGIGTTQRNAKLDVRADRDNAMIAELNIDGCNSTPTTCNFFTGKDVDSKKYDNGASPNRVRIDKNGTGFFNGGTQNRGADFAESMHTSDDLTILEPGDVLVIDPQNPRTVKKSTEANSRLVAGIYSTKPSVLAIGEHHIDDSLKGEVPVAVVGIVPTKVTTENGPIHIGDLLVTSSTPGFAMRASDNPAPGTILGKALGTLESGNGVIEVLVMLR